MVVCLFSSCNNMTQHLFHETCKTTSDMTWHATCCGCATPAAPLKQTHLLCGCATLAAPLHSSTSHETNIWECTSWSMTSEWNHLPIWQPCLHSTKMDQDASGEGNSREIFQTLNPKLQVIKVACNSQLLNSSSSSHATLNASFSFSSSKPSLHLGSLTVVHNSWVWYLDSIST